jgi:hypothetical protein
MSMKKWLSSLALVIVVLFVTFSCSKKNEQELGVGAVCDTNNMSYSADIIPILESICFSCHGNGLSENGINFDTYSGVKAVADNGKLVGAISHAAGFVAMPQSAPKLSDCNINKIKSWVNAGAANN